MKGRSVVGLLTGVIKMRNVSVYGHEEGSEENYPITNSNIWVGELDMEWGTAVKCACCRDKSYLREACRVSRWDGLSNECV